jgi:hypothetical protein
MPSFCLIGLKSNRFCNILENLHLKIIEKGWLLD